MTKIVIFHLIPLQNPY